MPRPDPEVPLRIGIFGGSFDPPHVGHLTVAADVADALSLDRVLWIPAGIPPHKLARVLTEGRIRLEMVRAAVGDHPRFAVDDQEVERPGPSYTVDTVRAIAARHPRATLYLILGVDQLRTFATGWRDSREILRSATLAAMDRDGSSTTEVPPLVRGMERTVHVPVTRVDLSSSEVRARVAAGGVVDDLVPPGVADVIRREGLYQN